MKILGIKFLNLNSLKGAHEIRFDQTPFSDSGLFAITGATGAGKTTILDAITVALYGKVHRHNKDACEMMSRHTAESYAEVEFEVNDVSYRAKWSVRRANGKVTGALQACKMELAEVSTGDFLGGHTLTSVQKAIVELCGLDYDQFLRSVILSQGDFTRFLKADDNERSELLEKMTDTGIYTEISKYAYERSKQENQKLETIRTRLKDVHLLSFEERSAYETGLHDREHKGKSIKKRQSLVTTEINWQNNLLLLQGKIEKLDAELSGQVELHTEHEPDFQRLNAHQKAVAYRPELMEIRTIQGQADQSANDLKAFREQLPLLQAEREKARLERDASLLTKAKAQKALSDIEPVLDRVIEADIRIATLQTQIQKLQQVLTDNRETEDRLKTAREIKILLSKQTEQDLKNLQIWLEEHKADLNLESTLTEFRQKIKTLDEISSAIAKLRSEQEAYLQLNQKDSAFIQSQDAAIARLGKDLIDTENSLQELMIRLVKELEGTSLEALESEVGKLPSLISTCEQQYQLAQAFQKLNTEKANLETELRKKKTEHAGHSSELQKLTIELASAEVQLKDLRAIVELEQRIKNYETDRLDLKPDQPCFLCGSLSHPYGEDEHIPQLSANLIKRDRQEEVVGNLNKTLLEKTTITDALMNWINVKGEQLSAFAADLSETEAGFRENNAALPKALDIENAGIIQAIIEKKRLQLSELNGRITQIREHKEKLRTTENSVAGKRQLLAEEKSMKDIAAERLRNNTEQFEKSTAAISAAQLNKTTLLTEISILLSPYSLNLEDQQIGQIESVLSNRLAKYQAAIKDVQEFHIKETALKTELTGIDQTLKEKHNELLLLEQELQQEKQKFEKLKADRLELFGEKSPAAERERINQAIKESVDTLESKLAYLQKKQDELNSNEFHTKQAGESLLAAQDRLALLGENLLLRLKEQGIASVEELDKLFLSEEEASRISESQKDIETRISTLKQQLQSISAEIKTEESKELKTQPLEDLELQLETINQEIDELNREIGRISQILQEDDRLKQTHATMAAMLEVQKAEYDRVNKLSVLIGSADGKKFSRFAQGLTLARLTDLANRHLLNLSDRYEILKSKEKDLELLIIDKHQADAIRPMATLSGGESFLVSLALALGLSDLASRKVQINSLFIDEGFGTLDAETLDIAISALENLQAKGKMIGVISHVEALKERIGAQIQVSKQQGGNSQIKILSYADQLNGL